MTSSSSSSSLCIHDGDYVCISGGGVRRIVEVRAGLRVRLGRAGSALTHSLVGMRYGAVVELQHRSKTFVATTAYPDLDLADAIAAMTRDEADNDNNNNDGNNNKDSNDNVDNDDDDDDGNTTRDNRALHDDNQSQRLSNAEVAAIRRDEGLGTLLTRLRDNSTTFAQKTRFAQEKYLRKKAHKYATLYKLERVYADNLAEVAVPTMTPSEAAEEPRHHTWLRLRADTLALLLHHGNVHARSRVLLYDKTNGVLPACLLARLGDDGRVYQVLDQTAQPNTHTAVRVMRLPQVKERWKAIPRNEGLLTGATTTQATRAHDNDTDNNNNKDNDKNDDNKRSSSSSTVSQWLRGCDARALLLTQPADSLLIVDDDAPYAVLRDTFDLLALCGHVVVYSPYLSDLTDAFAWLRERCVNVRLSETWYRHHQVMPRRTHPTVHMSTAGGYLLTALKVEQLPRATAAATAAVTTRKRMRSGSCDGDDHDDADTATTHAVTDA